MKVAPGAEQDDGVSTRFTCFTGTKAYWYNTWKYRAQSSTTALVLALLALLVKCTCFTGTNTDAEVAAALGFFFSSVELDASGCGTETAWEHLGTPTLLALLVQKYKY
jgi:hypothetical protein